jgi:hypothetical protein
MELQMNVLTKRKYVDRITINKYKGGSRDMKTSICRCCGGPIFLTEDYFKGISKKECIDPKCSMCWTKKVSKRASKRFGRKRYQTRLFLTMIQVAGLEGKS